MIRKTSDAAGHRFRCTQCGGDCRFVPDHGQLECAHCGALRPISQSGPWDKPDQSQPFSSAFADLIGKEALEESGALVCQNCAAEVLWNGPVMAMECPFCASPTAVQSGAHRHIRPRAIAPFVIDREAAKDALARWLRARWFAPTTLLRSSRRSIKMQGVYLPFWLFNAETSAYYEGCPTDARGHPSDTQLIAGQLFRDFKDLSIEGFGPPHNASVWGVGPWHLDALAPYRPDFLSGFKALAYSVGLQDASKSANQEMERQLIADAAKRIRGTPQSVESIFIESGEVSFRLALLPVWIASYTYRGTIWRAVVNGQTGKVHGEAPVSNRKTTISATLIFTGVVLLILLALTLF